MSFIEKKLMQFLFWLYLKGAKKRDSTKKPRLFWGSVPVKNFSYWNEAMKKEGYDTKTVMHEFYSINKKEDFDAYFFDIISPLYLRPFVYLQKLFPNLAKIHWVFYVADNFD